ncbi:deoxyribodipyrimidine photo-lyase [Rhodobacter sp. KR11]|uniref:FAD-binding domain-containing protein n=1 Tax=Rhodobacter sp. KR11 TaxID=2974588 RepID=UPI0022216D07|nr:FAD-binding domain-containing protein [Rhodobacter sp. KR11]MCW1918282.1 deoxyribodipyrimidine photo-lyase [Rhodobacter sp. KR11]
MTAILWFKRDLRAHDHPALTLASEGPVIPLYIAEPELWAQPDASARQWEFIAESLTELRQTLAGLGAPLVVRQGEAVDVLARLARSHRVSHLISHEETGNLWTFARDRRVAAWARDQGIVWTELPGQGVIRRLKSRNAWSRQRDAFAQAEPLPPPALHGPSIEPGPIPTARGLGLRPDPCPHRQTGGREAGLLLLTSFLTTRGAPYRTAMSSPVTAERACSRLSPHLAWGTLSSREVTQATTLRQADQLLVPWPGALSSFHSRLAWRDHFIQKLEDQPSIETRCLHRAAETLARTTDATRLDAWTQGQTGLPFLDACMRYLRATGWLNFRMRAMVVSVASYHLWLDWRATGAPLARMFTDYEPGIHWPQVQMQSGTTGINTPRIYNPVKQGQEQDPTGAFTRRWLPELADVPLVHLQEPWRWEGAGRLLGRRYPEPLVDVASAARAAKEAIFGLRKTANRAEIVEIIERHASRADRRFVNDRVPAKALGRRAPQAAGQLSFDL